MGWGGPPPQVGTNSCLCVRGVWYYLLHSSCARRTAAESPPPRIWIFEMPNIATVVIIFRYDTLGALAIACAHLTAYNRGLYLQKTRRPTRRPTDEESLFSRLARSLHLKATPPPERCVSLCVCIWCSAWCSDALGPQRVSADAAGVKNNLYTHTYARARKEKKAAEMKWRARLRVRDADWRDAMDLHTRDRQRVSQRDANWWSRRRDRDI